MSGNVTLPPSPTQQIMTYFVKFDETQPVSNPVVKILRTSYIADPPSAFIVASVSGQTSEFGFTVQLSRADQFTGWTFPVNLAFAILVNGMFSILALSFLCYHFHLGPCDSHLSCPTSQYCDVYRSCDDCSICLALNDTFNGLPCPSKCFNCMILLTFWFSLQLFKKNSRYSPLPDLST